jgi:hypothetical protein
MGTTTKTIRASRWQYIKARRIRCAGLLSFKTTVASAAAANPTHRAVVAADDHCPAAFAAIAVGAIIAVSSPVVIPIVSAVIITVISPPNADFHAGRLKIEALRNRWRRDSKTA